MRAGITQCGTFGSSLVAALVVLAGTSGLAHGAIVAVVNPSFESPITATFTPGITGWTGTGDFGVFRPDSHFPAYNGVDPPDGAQVAYSDGGLISQILSTLLMGETIYTLKVDIGNRLDLFFPGYSIGLYAGGNLLASSSSPTPADGTFATSTVQYVSPVNDPNIGQALEIRLISNGGQVNFDNVILDATPTPEPSTLTVIGLGAVGLAVSAWRRRKRAA
ncbi:MAG: PEP-CTERM sorting domain-containing protein [Pirellulaceae bacterium]